MTTWASITGTIEVAEVVWTVAALPGLVMWLINLRDAGRMRATARLLPVPNGRLTWARFSVQFCQVMVFVEATYVGLGVVSMTRPPNPAAAVQSPLVGLAIVLGLIAASTAVSFLGWRWRAVDRQLIAAARARKHLR